MQIGIGGYKLSIETRLRLDWNKAASMYSTSMLFIPTTSSLYHARLTSRGGSIQHQNKVTHTPKMQAVHASEQHTDSALIPVHFGLPLRPPA